MSDNKTPSDYRAEFNQAIREQLAAIERAMTTFNGFAEHMEAQLDTVGDRLRELQENDVELKRLIIEQLDELRALRARLDKNGGAQ